MPTKPAVAAFQGLLIFPALLFMGALGARNLPQSGLAQNAQRIVMWYAARQWTLWTLLIALPMAVLVVGGLTLLSSRNSVVERRPPIPSHVASRFVATATFLAGGGLAIVVLHMMAN